MDVCIEKCIHKDKVDAVLRNLPDSEGLSELLKALGDPGRLKIAISLLFEDLCVCDLSAISGLSESAVSHQLRVLRHLKIVRNRRDGKIMLYSLYNENIENFLRQIIATTI